MDLFVTQSLEGLSENEGNEEGELRVRRALFRIGDAREKVCEDSPLQSAINPSTRPAGEFDYKGKLVSTQSIHGAGVKLTKLFKRRDNEGKLFDSVKKMHLNQ